MYSLTFRVRVTTPPQCGRNGTSHATGSSILSPVRGVFAGMHSACGVRWAWRITVGSATHFHSVAIATQPVHRLQIRPNSAQLAGIPYHSAKLHPGPCSSVGMRPRTDRQTDTQTRVITIHFSWSTTHAKCNNLCLGKLPNFRMKERWG